MRVFQTIGITKKFLKYTIINKGTKFVNSNNKVVLDWPRPRAVTENGWYPSYRFHQPDLERRLRARLKDFKKVTIMQNTEVLKLKANKNIVKISLKNFKNKKVNEVVSKYVIGCDGARSTVREQIGSKFQNLGFTQKWAVIDLILKKEKKELPDRTIQYSNTKRPATYYGKENYLYISISYFYEMEKRKSFSSWRCCTSNATFYGPRNVCWN